MLKSTSYIVKEASAVKMQSFRILATVYDVLEPSVIQLISVLFNHRLVSLFQDSPYHSSKHVLDTYSVIKT